MKTVTRNEALAIIDQHGFGPDDCTLAHNEAHPIPGDDCESFNHSLGIKDDYRFSDIKNWLGY
jgi:hypothetical protein